MTEQNQELVKALREAYTFINGRDLSSDESDLATEVWYECVIRVADCIDSNDRNKFIKECELL